MWCDACRSVGTIHCAHPDECGNMLSNNAAAENWNAWLDDLPIGAEFHPAIDRLQDFIAGLAVPTPAVQPDTRERDRLREALNQSRLAFAGHVSVQSAIDLIARAALKGESHE